MTRGKILITEALPFVSDELNALQPYADVNLAKSTREEHLLELVSEVDLIMVVFGKITSRIIESAPKLRGIVRYGIGIDNIDVGAACKRKIPVANVPNYAIETVADHAMALMLALARRIIEADKAIRTRSWGIWTSPPSTYRGVDLSGKTVGIIGIGRIGRAFAKRASAFDMKIIAYDPNVAADDVKKLNIQLVSLDEVLSNSDFISIHAPLTNETRNLIDEKQIQKMKTSSYLINTSRGGLINMPALVKAVKENRIAGVALDVFHIEPPDHKDPLLDLERVVLTPHIAWYTEEAVRRLEMTGVQQAIAILRGDRPENLVNPSIYA